MPAEEVVRWETATSFCYIDLFPLPRVKIDCGKNSPLGFYRDYPFRAGLILEVRQMMYFDDEKEEGAVAEEAATEEATNGDTEGEDKPAE
jgi:hypothetical protein